MFTAFGRLLKRPGGPLLVAGILIAVLPFCFQHLVHSVGNIWPSLRPTLYPVLLSLLRTGILPVMFLTGSGMAIAGLLQMNRDNKSKKLANRP